MSLCICKICGFQAKTNNDLQHFERDKRHKIGHLKTCKKCRNIIRSYQRNHFRKKLTPETEFYYRDVFRESEFYNWNVFYDNFLRPIKKCIVCGIGAYTEQELEFFLPSKSSKHSRINKCKKCQSKITAERTRVRRKNDAFWGKFQTLSSSSSRRKSEAKGRVFNLTWEYLERLAEEQNYCCALTGIPLKRKDIGGKRHYNAPSVDRIDNSRGYERGERSLDITVG